MTTKAIPFTKADRSTIRSTSLWMMIAGAIVTLNGGYLTFLLLSALMTHGKVNVEALVMAVLIIGGLLGLGILLLIGSRRFATVAVSGDIKTLSSGLSALTIIYVVQAVLMLLAIAWFLFAFLLTMVS